VLEGSVMGVDVGVGVDVAVLVGVGGTGVEVGGIGIAEDVGVGVGVEILRRVGDGCIEVTVSAAEPCTTAESGRESLASRATETPATKLRIGTSIQPFPTTRLPMPRHQSNRQSAVFSTPPAESESCQALMVTQFVLLHKHRRVWNSGTEGASRSRQKRLSPT